MHLLTYLLKQHAKNVGNKSTEIVHHGAEQPTVSQQTVVLQAANCLLFVYVQHVKTNVVPVGIS